MLVALVAGVEPVPCLTVEAAPVVFLVTAVLVVRDVLVAVLAVRLAPTTSLRPEVPLVALFAAEELMFLLPFTDETLEVFLIFPALTEFLAAVPLPVEKPLRCP